MRNIHRRTQTLDRQSFVPEKPKSLALKFWAAFIVQLSKPNILVSNLEFLENHGVWVPMQHNECINFHVFSRWMARSSRVHDMSIGKEWMSEEAKISKFFQRNLPPDPRRNLHLLGEFFLRLLQSFCHLLKTLWKTLNPLSRSAQCSFVLLWKSRFLCVNGSSIQYTANFFMSAQELHDIVWKWSQTKTEIDQYVMPVIFWLRFLHSPIHLMCINVSNLRTLTYLCEITQVYNMQNKCMALCRNLTTLYMS